MMCVKFEIYKDPIGKYRIQVPELVGTDNNWRLPMDLLKLTLPDYLLFVKINYHANIRFYRGADNKIRFIGLFWDETHKKYAEAFKNLLNKILDRSHHFYRWDSSHKKLPTTKESPDFSHGSVKNGIKNIKMI